MSKQKKSQKRPWKIVHNTPDSIIWQQREFKSIIVRLDRQQDGEWTGFSHFGNWMFPATPKHYRIVRSPAARPPSAGRAYG